MKDRFMVEIKNAPGRDDVKVLEFKGEIDISNSHKIIEVMFPLIEEGFTQLVGDFSNLDYINSSGIFNLLRCYAKLREVGGFLKFVGVKENLLSMFDSLGITKIFTMHSSVEEALKE